MKERIKSISVMKSATALLYICFFGVLMIYMQDFSFQNHSDDVVYQNTFANYSSWCEWAKVYYHNWSGRVAIHALLIVLLNLPVQIWRGLVALAILGTVHYTIKIAKMFIEYTDVMASIEQEAKTGKKNLVVSILLVLLPFGMFLYFWHMFDSWVFTWCSGSANYLFPGCCLLISLYPVLQYACNRAVRKKDIVLALLTGIITGSSEQTAAIFLVYSALLLVSVLIFQRERRISLPVWVLSILIDVMAFISIFAPGNQVRAQMEVMWFPTFSMFDVLDKLILGMQHYTGHMYRTDTLLFILIMYCTLLVLNRKNIKNEIFIVLGVMVNLVVIVLSNTAFSEWYINPHWYLYICWLLILFLTPMYNAWLLYTTFSESSKQLALTLVLFYLAAICSCVVLGFSPTVYASGIRAFYIYQLLLFVLNIVLIYHVFRSDLKHTRLFLNDLGALGCLAAAIVASIVFIAVFLNANKISTIFADDMSVRESVLISEVSVVEKSGYTQITAFVQDLESNFTYYNWVNGSGQSAYLNADIILRNGNEYMVLSTYPKPNEDDLQTMELRGYIPSNMLENLNDIYEIGLIVYDQDGNALGYSLLDEAIGQ